MTSVMNRRAFLAGSGAVLLSAPLAAEGQQAGQVGLELQPVRTRRPDEIDGAFAVMSRARADGLIVLPDPMFGSLRARIADLASKGRLPAMYGLRQHTEAGGLMSYAASLPDLIRRAAGYVDRILKGAKPADLARRTTHALRTGHQPPQDREDPRPDDSPVAAAAGG